MTTPPVKAGGFRLLRWCALLCLVLGLPASHAVDFYSGLPPVGTPGVPTRASVGESSGSGGHADTATALAANGSNCLPTESATGADEFGNAEGCHDPLTGIPDPSIILTTTNTKEVTNKQIVPRVNALVNTAGSVAYNCDTTDVGTLDGITAGITLALPTCTGTNPKPEHEIEYRLQSTLPQTIAYNAAFCAMSGFPLPTATSGDLSGVKTYDRLKFRRNAVESCWTLVATTTGIGKGITTLGSSATFTCSASTSAQCQMSSTVAAGTLTVSAPTGTPTDGQMLLLLFACQNLQTFAFNAIFLASPNIALPTSCPADLTKFTAVGVRYSTLVSGGPKWQVLGVN